MTSSSPGTCIPGVEVSNIDAHGLWLLVHNTEYFLPYENFPWFREARLANILEVELLLETHLHWPSLDVDLSVESLESPGRFPVVYRAAKTQAES